MKLNRIAAFSLFFCGVLIAANAQFDARFESPGASEQFRLGVQAYHSGRYSESILLFEKALAFAPRQNLVSYWLGRAYEKIGLEATTLRAWSPLLTDPASPPFLRSKVEALRANQGVREQGTDESSYVEAARFSGVVGKTIYFSRPSALIPQRDGSVYVVAQGTNELVRIDPNGVITNKDRGRLQGYDRPWGLASLPDGTLFITEFNGDRISRLGNAKLLSFGSKGRGPGELLGPQYAVCDEEGYLYVTDYGNARVLKFDSDGSFVLAFGEKTDDFPGFVSPGGIAEKDGVVFVADSYRKTIYRFDPSGNYLGSLGEAIFHFPEGLSFWQEGRALLVADTDRIMSVDLDSERASVIYQSPDRKARLVGAASDFNGNLLACDFDASTVLILTEAPEMAKGYDVEIERVYADSFPKVELDVRIRDRFGMPVVGLQAPNFRISERVITKTQSDERGMAVTHTTESQKPVKDMELVSVALPSSPLRAEFLLERSPSMDEKRADARDALASLYSLLSNKGSTTFGLVSAGKVPAVEGPLGSSLSSITQSALASTGTAVPGRFDLGLRLAISELLPSGPRDAIVYVGTGLVDDASFQGTTLSELSAYLKNNGIRLYAVLVGEGQPSPSLRFLVDESGGSIYAADRARGLGDLASDLATAASGRYRLRFVSGADSGFGESYLSVAVEAYLYKKSGRDELGFFAPLR
jgi:DNA-binding beta-propeller fold protein YncE